jgi:hypothetical protein
VTDLDPGCYEFFVQAKDNIGNVALIMNHNEYFAFSPSAAVRDPSPPAAGQISPRDSSMMIRIPTSS